MDFFAIGLVLYICYCHFGYLKSFNLSTAFMPVFCYSSYFFLNPYCSLFGSYSYRIEILTSCIGLIHSYNCIFFPYKESYAVILIYSFLYVSKFNT